MSGGLERAWQWRERREDLKRSQALRVFHGPGEGKGLFQFFAVDRFKDHYWVTEWQNKLLKSESSQVLSSIVQFYRSKGAVSIVGISRPERGVAPLSHLFSGSWPDQDSLVVKENNCQYLIRLKETRHPGLFLDHEPLRRWLSTGAMRGLSLLNTFAYTGSLSVAASVGGAKHVTTLDLSNNTVEWAKKNSELNAIASSTQTFLSGDVFDWLPRFKRRQQTFDCIILDPPSFSHGKNNRFSTAKDLVPLHELAFQLLTPHGMLVTSINSAQVERDKYESEILKAAARSGLKEKLTIVEEISLPETFPTVLGNKRDRYLKGWILRT